MHDIPLDIYFAFMGIGGGASMLLGLVILRLTLTRRLKKKLMETDSYWDSGSIDFGFFNTAVFAWACAVPLFEKLEKFQLLYPDLNVRNFANWYERAAAYGTIYGAMVFVLCIPFFYLFKP